LYQFSQTILYLIYIRLFVAIEYIYLDNSIEPDKSLLNLLNIIKQNVQENIWSRPLLLKYTDHGIKHSERVIKIIEQIIGQQIKTEKKLNSYEIFILYASTLLHDIGMQITLEKKANVTQTDNILDYYNFGKEDVTELKKDDYELIRENHAIVSYKMIIDSIKENKYKLGLNATKYGIELAEYIAEVCKNHQGIHKVEFEENFNIHHNPIRLSLLCYLLRIADEFDLDNQRINLEELQRVNICTDSKFHWWLHHYTDSVEIKNENIHIYLKFPEHFEIHLINLIWYKMLHKLEKAFTIKEDIDHLIDIFYENNIKLHLKREPIIAYDHAGSKQTIPQELEEYILNTLSMDSEIENEKIKIKTRTLNSKVSKTKKWLEWFGFKGNPFTDIVYRFNPIEFIKTDIFQRIIDQSKEILSSPTGEIRLIKGERGSGKTSTIFALCDYFQKHSKIKSIIDEELINIKIIRIDVSDIILNVPSGRELWISLLKKLNNQLEIERKTSESIDEDSSLFDKKIDELEKNGEKILLLIDNIDRLGMHETELRIVSEFFQSAQHSFQYLKKVGLIIISCRHNWEELLTNPDFNYLDYTNSWELTKFDFEQFKYFIERRLLTSNIKIDNIFEPNALKILYNEADGIPRYILQVCEQSCRIAALHGKKRITEDLIQDIYGHDISDNIYKAIKEASSSSLKSKNGFEKIFNYYCYLERNRIHLHTGFEIIKELKDKSIVVTEISRPYQIGLIQCGIASKKRMTSKANTIIEGLHITRDVLEFFKNFELKGFNIDDFIIHYEEERIRPISDLNLALDEFTRKILIDEHKNCLDECRKQIDNISSLQNEPRNLILECSRCIEIIIKIILLQVYSNDNVKKNVIKKMQTKELKQEMIKYLENKNLTFNYLAELEYILNKKILIERNKLQTRMMKKNEIQNIVEITKSTIQNLLELYNRNF
jgi:type II secretory pathway predicted ATPase ExeA